MSWISPSDPVGGTIITVAAYVSNALNNIRHLRVMTGNADPPGSAYVAVSDSTTGVTWKKVPSDALATGVAVANLGYTPLKNTTDTLTGNLTISGGSIIAVGASIGAGGVNSAGAVSGTSLTANPGGVAATTSVAAGTSISAGTDITATGNMTAGTYNGGTTGGGSVSASAFHAGGSGFTGTGPVSGTTGTFSAALGALSAAITNLLQAGSATITGLLTIGSITGGSAAAGSLSVKGLIVGSDGAAIGAGGVVVTGGNVTAVAVTATGAMSAGSYTNGSTSAGSPAFKGATIGTDGISNGGPYSGGSTTGGTDVSLIGANVGAHGIASSGPIFITGSEVYWPGNPPPLGSGAAVPSGLIAAFQTAAAIASGWNRCDGTSGRPNLDGRVPVGAGTTFTVAYTENTAYGSSWAHQHTSNSFSVSATGSAVGGPTDVTGASASTLNGRFTAGGANALPDSHTHPLNGVSLAVSASGTATGSTSNASWVIPSYAVVWAQKS